MLVAVTTTIVLLTWVPPSQAFFPNRVWDVLVSVTELSRPQSYTHHDIPTVAALKITLSLFRDNPSPQTTRHQLPNQPSQLSTSPRGLFRQYYGNRRTTAQRLQAFQTAVHVISQSNEEVDLWSSYDDAAAHFDAELFQAAQDRMLLLRSIVVMATHQGSLTLARRSLGQLLHTLQDFYSHSNWVELGRTEPYNVLGRQGQRPSRIAPPDMAACQDCRRSGRANLLLQLLLHFKFDQLAKYTYDCSDNVHPQILENGVLTSNYFSGCRDPSGAEILKPQGKCSHGGITDAYSDVSATGGLNKDSVVTLWTFLREKHAPAAQLATRATVDLLQDMRAEVADDNAFAAIFNIKLEDRDIVSGIGIILDTNQGMSDELSSVLSLFTVGRDILEGGRTEGGGAIEYTLVPFANPGK